MSHWFFPGDAPYLKNQSVVFCSFFARGLQTFVSKTTALQDSDGLCDFLFVATHYVGPRAIISISLHFDRCNPPERTPFEHKCTAPTVAGGDRYSELFHCRGGNLADNSCYTQVK
jgi:hypothetical protein